MICYLDNSATTRACPACIEAVSNALGVTFGNPSSLHHLGLEAEQLIEKTTKCLQKALKAEGTFLYTSGATEANNLAIFGSCEALKRRGNRIVTTAFEHASVLTPFEELKKQGFDVRLVYPDGQGHISPDAFLKECDENTILASMMLVNNEVGTVTPVQEIARGIRQKSPNAYIHCDAVQGFMKLPIRLNRWDVDLLSFSGHKIHGPKGIGGLYLRRGVRLKPLFYGGGQQGKLRPGTENVAYIAGLGAAVEELADHIEENFTKAEKLNQALREGLRELPEITINSPEDASPYILNLSVEGIRSEIMLHYLEGKDIFVSSASACSKGAKSHVLASMGVPDKRIDSALRISFCSTNTKENVQRLLDGLKSGLAELARSR